MTGSPNVKREITTATAITAFNSHTVSIGRSSSVHDGTRHTQTHRRTDRQTDRQTDTHTDTQLALVGVAGSMMVLDTHTHRRTDRQTDTHTDTHTLDYCNALLHAITDNPFWRLQSTQNAAARLLADTRQRDHISPVLSHLHCETTGRL